YIDGRTSTQYYCIDCGKEVANYNAKRCRECYLKFNTGKSHPNYIDGTGNAPYPPEFNDKLKQKIRRRDNYTCQNCGITEEEHIIVFGKVLGIHHIDYNKFNCKEENLITLCHQCNVRVNFNRGYWKKYFESKSLNRKAV
ncbi:hypothetical protein LCGC14_1279730, partial [marine sediment metagenome]